ncbi:hypothetical protein [Deinococcus sp.]|uniref:hypothetical protein n=1 Tax=Deinococcus sp. TaxID=47478 RepID=UPI003B5CDC7E
MIRRILTAGLFMLLVPAALAQQTTVPEPPTAARLATMKETLALDVPAGAKTMLISRTGSDLTVLELPAGAKRVSLGVNLTPKVYQDSWSVRSGTNSSEGNVSGGMGIRLYPLNTKRLSPALNVWTLLWNGTQPSNVTFSLTVGNTSTQSAKPSKDFQVQALFSSQPAEKIDESLRPPTRP